MEKDSRTAENPYAPPESDSQDGRMRGKALPGSFWIEDGKLSMIHEGLLPDVCLKTGAVDGWLTRNPERFSWRPPWIPWLFFFLVLGSLILWPQLVPILLLVWFLASIFTVETIRADYCLSRDAVRTRRILSWLKLAYLGSPILLGFVSREWIVLGLFLWPLVALVGLFMLNLLFPFPAPAVVRNGVVTLKNVSPEALRQLRRWQNSRPMKPNE